MTRAERRQHSRGPTRAYRTWLLAVLLAAALQNPPAHADDTNTNVAFVDGSAATLSPDSSGTFKLDIPVKNSGREGNAVASLLGDKQCAGATLAPRTLGSLKKNALEMKSFEVSNIKLPATCYIELVSDGTDGNRSLKQIKLNQKYAKSGVLIALGICLVLSLAAVKVGCCLAGESLGFRMGTPAWDFAKSWTSTTTLVGAIVSTALALGALPELTKYASKSGYAVLSLLTSLVVVIAPFVFTVFRTGEVEKDTKTGTYSVVYQGWLWALLVSCAMTLFAGLAQLVLFFLLLHEIFQDYGFWSYSDDRDPLSANLGCISTFVLALALIGYSVYSVYLTIKLQGDANRLKAAEPTEDAAQAAIRAQAMPRKSALLTWPVL